MQWPPLVVAKKVIFGPFLQGTGINIGDLGVIVDVKSRPETRSF